MTVHACYFDGRSSRRHDVVLSVAGDVLVLTGELERSCPLRELDISGRSQTAPRKIRFTDGAFLEVADSSAFAEMLERSGYRDSAVVRMEQSWRAAGAALLATVGVLVALYVWGLPAASEAIARMLPAKAERAIGGEALAFLDQHILAPSELDEARKNALSARFGELAPPRNGAPEYRLLFRKSKIGPNAFALPSGEIVMTDDIVKLVDDDDALMGVLAHELGHLHERHLLRRLIQSSAIGIVSMALLGDVSSVVANIPTVLLDMKYSRDAEREADDYAVAMLGANGIDPGKMAMVFERLAEKNGESEAPYLASHPPSKERIARIRKQ